MPSPVALLSELEFHDIAAELDERSRGAPCEMPHTRSFAEFLSAFVAQYGKKTRLTRYGPERLFANALHIAFIKHGFLTESDTNTEDMFSCAARLAPELDMLSRRGFKQDLDEIIRMRDVCLTLSGRTTEIRRRLRVS